MADCRTAIIKFTDAKEATSGLNKLHGLKFAKYELSAYSLYSFSQASAAPDVFQAPVNLTKAQLLEWNKETMKSMLTLQVGNKAVSYWISHLESEPTNIFAKPIDESKKDKS